MKIIQVRLFHFPGVAHGGVAVADVHGVAARNNSLRDGMRGGEDHIELPKIDSLDRSRHPREEDLVIVRHLVPFLERRRTDVCMREGAEPSSIRNRREERSGGPERSKLIDGVFGSAECCQPIRNEGEVHVARS